MNPRSIFEFLLYFFVIVLCAICLTMAATSPGYNFEAKVVYRGF